MCPGVQVLCLSLTPTVRGGCQGPVTCSLTAHSTACIPCNLLHVNGPCVIQSPVGNYNHKVLSLLCPLHTPDFKYTRVSFEYPTSLAQDALGVWFGSLCGPAACVFLSAAGSLQHQVIWRHEILQHDSDEHHHRGLKLYFAFLCSQTASHHKYPHLKYKDNLF